MALQRILMEEKGTLLSRLQPLHIGVVCIKDQPRVISWNFTDSGEAKPSVTKENKMVVVSDGCSVATLLLFEEYSAKVTLGQGYVMRRYSLRGQSPPYQISVSRDTQFFSSTPVPVSQKLQMEAERLLNPVSKMSPLKGIKKTQGLVTVEGEVVKISAIKRMQVKNNAVPLKMLTLQEDSTQVAVNLWREAAVLPLQKGAQIRLTHLRSVTSKYGHHLQSTTFTAFEDVPVKTCILGVMGVLECDDKPGMLQLLVQENDTVFETELAVWHPVGKKLCKVPFKVKVQTVGKKIISVEAVEEEEEEAEVYCT
ncbi:uncharacterized protein LOC118322726 [Morone saxatilis]|uniref:uncharacterized protein LOC118322726 n=1 Tax=Morone saxatilis TaxID=34816 RepID=UPI0015E23807|nr:uncharacterized protein LOC118322726 [Morone saxatilis]